MKELICLIAIIGSWVALWFVNITAALIVTLVWGVLKASDF